MSPDASDSQLVTAYAAEGSEAAFRALVTRHVNLVFATALRQVGDAGASEEIAQNVFVTLAHKAPRLGGVETLAGWLYRATILEAKARVRRELRRARREQTAAQLATLQREGASPLETLLPLLDEALLQLRDHDRLALLLRFFENRSLREVGSALGVDEDAARKRVSRALDRVTEFFRRRGFAMPVGISGAALLAHAARSAPAGLAATSANAGLAAGGAATGLNLLLFHIMALTKTQTVAICALVAALPLALQRQTQARAGRAHEQATAQLAAAGQDALELSSEIQRTRAALEEMRRQRQLAEARRAALPAPRAPQAAPAAYAWNDAATLARVPKAMLERLQFDALVDVNGALSRQIKELLQMTDDEAQRVEEVVKTFLADFRNVEGTKLKPVPARREELGQHAQEDVRVFEVANLQPEFMQLRATLLADLQTALGEERMELFKRGLEERVPIEDDGHGVSSIQAVYPGAKRVAFERPGTPQPDLRWSLHLKLPNGGSAYMGLPHHPPEPYRTLVADWIDLEQQLQQAAKQRRTPP